jgi:uridine kinase
MNNSNFTIVISGISGSGKTSLVREVTALLEQSVAFHFDDYASVSNYPTDIKEWVATGAEASKWETLRMTEDLQQLRQGKAITLPNNQGLVQPAKYIVVEEPFGRGRAEISQHIDFVAYIDVPMEIAFCRKLKRDLNTLFKNNCDESLKYVNDILEGYLEGGLREVYQASHEIARSSCDLILDGTKPTSELAEIVVNAVHTKTQVSKPTIPNQ